MPFAPGTKLGPYEILAPLGAGGMGEVYRARDNRLDRIVAIKVLPERLCSEFRSSAALGSRSSRHLQALTSQYLHSLRCWSPGRNGFSGHGICGRKTLRDLLASSTLSMRRLISIAVQIAEGLAKAHESGIIHRDLKPENLMISPDVVKILDFGLAKLGSEEEELDDGTATTNLPGQGEILGTFRYMSPEQASGRTLDFRSDQFSFGLVLYEMATGNHPFQRKTPSQTLLAIITEDPKSISSLNPEVPPPLSWVVERCLAKEPEKRYFSTLDLVRDLTAIRDRLSDLQSRRPESRTHNLPVLTTAFIGREKELAAVRQLLLRDDVRLVTSTGPGGIGKSRLAIEVARDVADRFSSGACLVPLAAVTDPHSIALVIASRLSGFVKPRAYHH